MLRSVPRDIGSSLVIQIKYFRAFQSLVIFILGTDGILMQTEESLSRVKPQALQLLARRS